jgi:hypothetical protein
MNIASKVIGIVALMLMLLGLNPFLGRINMLAVVIAIIGLIIGIYGKNKGGMILNGIVSLYDGWRNYLNKTTMAANAAIVLIPP